MVEPLPFDSPAVSEHHFQFGPCYAHLVGNTFTIGNGLIERRWQVKRGLLYPTVLRVHAFESRSGYDWMGAAADEPAPTPALTLVDGMPELNFVARGGQMGPTEQVSLQVELGASFAMPGYETPERAPLLLLYSFQVFPGASSMTMRVEVRRGGPDAPLLQSSGKNGVKPAEAGGVEPASPLLSAEALPALDRLEWLALPAAHLRLLQVSLYDQTDIHNELVAEREWLLHPAEGSLELQGNLFVLEDSLSGQGLILLKHAPLPHARPQQNHYDLLVLPRAGRLGLYGHGLGTSAGPGYAWGVIPYSGGSVGRTLALHAYQRQFRAFDPQRDARFISNTWGDRSRDARINEDFMRKEIEAGARLGVDVIQIDDGWEQGRTANSAMPGGVWIGFWASDPNFWQVNRARFPHGLEPVIAEARAKGLGFGLWFGPDSADSFANWQRDADTLLELHRRLGIHYFKIDGVKATSKAAERNLQRFFERVLAGSGGQVVFDLDVTAEICPGYFGAMQVGPLFVENRYTDWRRYWPHFTLRNLWKLAHYVDPARLRIEFLNNSRNTRLYAGDPLAPAAYRPGYLFATTLFANPLGWFEMSNLPEAYFEEIPPLARAWKAHRAELFGGQIVPLGSAPDGAAWTGFASVALDGRSGYLLLFRELNQRADWTTQLPLLLPDAAYPVERLGGAGQVTVSQGQVKAHLPQAQSFLFARFGPPQS